MSRTVMMGIENMVNGYMKMSNAVCSFGEESRILSNILNTEMCDSYQSMFRYSLDELGLDEDTENVFEATGYECRYCDTDDTPIKNFIDGMNLMTKGLLYIKNVAHEQGSDGYSIKIKLKNGKVATVGITSSDLYVEKNINKLFFKFNDFRMGFTKALNNM